MIETIDQIEEYIKEILEFSKQRLRDESCIGANRFVVGVILREFKSILNAYYESGKLRFSNRNFPIGSRWTIIDSANFDSEDDKQLFYKVREFEELCKIIDEQFIVYDKEKTRSDMQSVNTQMINRAKEIIKLSEDRLSDKSCSVQNKFVIKAILNEFNGIMKFIMEQGKLLLVCHDIPIGTRWLIIDCSCDSSVEDDELFNKVREFNDLCETISEEYKIYRYC